MRVKKILASTIAVLDSNVHTGGGTDDTKAIQSVLDMAKNEETGIHLVMDGAALVSHLELYSNTTIECINKDCGFYQMDHVDDALITNAIWDHYNTSTRNISLLGGTYNQNCLNQAHNIHREKEVYQTPDGRNVEEIDFTLCIVFYGVENLLVRDITIAQFRTFAFTLGCFKHAIIEDVWLDMQHHMNGNQDGFHFWGPGKYLTVRDCGGCVSDDIMNIGPDEMDHISTITDVLVDGLFLDDAEQAVRLLVRDKGFLDRVTIRNISGQYRSFGFYITPWFQDEAYGHFGNIFIENVDLKEYPATYNYREPILFSVGGNIDCLTLKNIRHHNGYDTRPLFDFGSAWDMGAASGGSVKQHLNTIIIEDLQIMEDGQDPLGKTYIKIYDKIDHFVLRNIYIQKDQSVPNGKFIEFIGEGCVENLITNTIQIDGVETVCTDTSRIKNRRYPKNELI